MMKKLFIAALGLLIAGCASVRTNADFDTDTNFSSYRTWAWIEPADLEDGKQYHTDGLMDQRIRSAITQELNAKGLQQVSVTEADLLVNYLTKIEKKINIDTFYSNFGYHPYYYGRYPLYTPIQTDTRVREYQEGTILVDLVDAQSKSLVWRGSGTDTVKQRQSPEERTEQVNTIVNGILLQFPPEK
ncbi:DUF4136 domain-containing protein [Ferrimonas gelatinilytica]|uniref:DUF4136 domain-containing protein n=1 Tax=Ferrimonas gelatinilytica TaxID=1255257 RepID=A0ABP9S446_9GAMM